MEKKCVRGPVVGRIGRVLDSVTAMSFFAVWCEIVMAFSYWTCAGFQLSRIARDPIRFAMPKWRWCATSIRCHADTDCVVEVWV
ncbi:hypothetical protein K458DRAFT_196975 [Lentithecium fluviatile CBS 122367]|uniref:Uncharacterized protein n=1 Tax=Lentithecium fluviatile CBS 122367 TaxID=1168545 RepID=A0A6G1ICC0_9PLEO|nr:hypothetical protein K458DRAFT_196975 [Lentithecium fluviatile CBS 122367]